MMSRRHLRRLIMLLVPLLALRALVPTGYMVASGSGELRLVLCDASLGGSDMHAMSGHQEHDPHLHHHGDGNGHDRMPSAGEHCPFAHAPFNAPPARMLVVASVHAPVFRFLSRSIEHLPPTTGPPRETSARAPPDFQRSTPV